MCSHLEKGNERLNDCKRERHYYVNTKTGEDIKVFWNTPEDLLPVFSCQSMGNVRYMRKEDFLAAIESGELVEIGVEEYNNLCEKNIVETHIKRQKFIKKMIGNFSDLQFSIENENIVYHAFDENEHRIYEFKGKYVVEHNEEDYTYRCDNSILKNYRIIYETYPAFSGKKETVNTSYPEYLELLKRLKKGDGITKKWFNE